MVTVPQLVKMVRDRYLKIRPGTTAYDINNGSCEEFADDLISLIPGASVWNIVESTQMLLDEHKKMAKMGIKFVGEPTNLVVNYKGTIIDLPGHYWIKWKGRHYDAECPDGVKDWLELPVFKNSIRRQILKKRGRKNG